MGEVYRAVDSVLERPVAVKLLSDRYAHESEARARFRREALAAARVSHSNHVVTIFDVGEHEGRPLIVMEFVDGGSVHDALRRGRVPREQALAWLAQAADALDRAHAEGIVHRDVKPANLLLDRDGSVRVSDFGIASTTGTDTITLPGTILGTVGYLSPEQARGEPATAASDRYSLAVVAFELLTGRRPFESETATTEILAHLNAAVPRASSLGAELPSAVDAVFHQALSKDPAERPASSAELVRDLREALEQGPREVDAVDAAGIEVEAPTRRIMARPSARAGRRASYALAFVLVAATVGAVALLGSSGGGSRDAASHRPSKPVTAVAHRAPPGIALNNVGYAQMRAGNYAAALSPLRRAVLALRGTHSLTEAYASYNLAFTRFALGACNGVTGLLARSQQIQGYRSEIDALRTRWLARCSLAPIVVDGSGQAHGKGNGHGQGHGGDGGEGD